MTYCIDWWPIFRFYIPSIRAERKGRISNSTSVHKILQFTQWETYQSSKEDKYLVWVFLTHFCVTRTPSLCGVSRAMVCRVKMWY